MDFEILDVGDKVRHPKFGNGVVLARSSDNENQKVTVKFGAEYGEKKLLTRIANLKRTSERPQLAPGVAAPGAAFPGASGVAVTKVPAKSSLDEDENEPEEEDDDELLEEPDLGDDDELLDEDFAEDDDEEE